MDEYHRERRETTSANPTRTLTSETIPLHNEDTGFRLTTDAECANRLMDRAARDIAEAANAGSTNEVERMLPTYRWLKAILAEVE